MSFVCRCSSRCLHDMVRTHLILLPSQVPSDLTAPHIPYLLLLLTLLYTGITSSSGSVTLGVDYSALTRLPSTLTHRTISTLSHRSTSLAKRRVTVGGIIFIVILVVFLIGLIVCGVCLGLIWKNKRARRKREAALKEQGSPLVLQGQGMPNSTPPGSTYGGGGQVAELSQDSYVRDGLGNPYGGRGTEMDGGTEVQAVQQLDGYAAPAKTDGVVELPAQAGR